MGRAKGVVTTPLGVLAVAAVALSAGACTGCELSCGALETPMEEVTAEVASIDGPIVTFEPADASRDQLTVFVNGQVDALDEGKEYLVPLYGTALELETHDGQARTIDLEAVLDGCTCHEAEITHTDGSPVDTSVWAQYGPFHVAVDKALLVVAVTFTIGVGVWALVRRRSGSPL